MGQAETFFLVLFSFGMAALGFAAAAEESRWVTFECGGAPWACSVSTWRPFKGTVDKLEPAEISVGTRSRARSGKGPLTYRSYSVLTFDGVDVSAERRLGELAPIVTAMNDARARGAPYSLRLWPSAFFWFLIAFSLALIGIGAGAIFKDVRKRR